MMDFLGHPPAGQFGRAAELGGMRGDTDGNIARHAHPPPLMLDLDLGKTRLVQELGELADEVLVEGPCLFCHLRRSLLRHQPALCAAIEAATASMPSS